MTLLDEHGQVPADAQDETAAFSYSEYERRKRLATENQEGGWPDVDEDHRRSRSTPGAEPFPDAGGGFRRSTATPPRGVAGRSRCRQCHRLQWEARRWWVVGGVQAG